MLSRRAFLGAAGGAVVLAAAGVAVEQPGIRQRLRDVVHPEPSAPEPSASSGPHRSGVLASRARGCNVGWQLAFPPGRTAADRLPVALVLHGRGGTARSAFDDLALDRYLADVVRGGAAAVAADSPALWQRAADTTAGAFDDSADFAAHDVFGGRARLAGIPVRIACGTRDPFFPAVRAFAPGVPDLAGTDFSTGDHTTTFWRRSAPEQLRFLAAALAA